MEVTKESEKREQYLEEKTFEKMRKLASKFSANEINWIAEYVKKLTTSEEAQPSYRPNFTRKDDPFTRGLIKERRVTSNCYTAEETLVELKIRYGRFLDDDYNLLDVEPYMDHSYIYTGLKHEMESKRQ